MASNHVSSRDYLDRLKKAFGYAADAGLTFEDCIRERVSSGFDLNTSSSRSSPPLILAAYASSLSVINVLLELGANPNISNKSGMTPLIRAASRGQSDVAIALIRAGANVNQRDLRGRSAFTRALERVDSAKMLKALVDAGADLFERDDRGVMPISMALYAYWREIDIGDGQKSRILLNSVFTSEQIKEVLGMSGEELINSASHIDAKRYVDYDSRFDNMQALVDAMLMKRSVESKVKKRARSEEGYSAGL